MGDWWIPVVVFGGVLALGFFLRWRKHGSLTIGTSAADPLAPWRAAIRLGDLPEVPTGFKAYRSAVAGEAQRNADGSRRQEIIRRLRVGDSIRLEAEPHNRYDKFAVRVVTAQGQIGYLPKGHHSDSEVEEGRLQGFIGGLNTGAKGITGVVLVLVRSPKKK